MSFLTTTGTTASTASGHTNNFMATCDAQYWRAFNDYQLCARPFQVESHQRCGRKTTLSCAGTRSWSDSTRYLRERLLPSPPTPLLLAQYPRVRCLRGHANGRGNGCVRVRGCDYGRGRQAGKPKVGRLGGVETCFLHSRGRPRWNPVNETTGAKQRRFTFHGLESVLLKEAKSAASFERLDESRDILLTC